MPQIVKNLETETSGFFVQPDAGVVKKKASEDRLNTSYRSLHDFLPSSGSIPYISSLSSNQIYHLKNGTVSAECQSRSRAPLIRVVTPGKGILLSREPSDFSSLKSDTTSTADLSQSQNFISRASSILGAKPVVAASTVIRKLFGRPTRNNFMPSKMSKDEEFLLKNESMVQCTSTLLILGDRSYKVKKTIGLGYNGFVKLAIDMSTGKKVAVKAVGKSSPFVRASLDHASSARRFSCTIDEKAASRVLREIRLLKLLNHPNIVKLNDVFETQDEYLLVMEHVDGGELFHYILNHGKLTESRARRIFRQLVSAVLYCHRHFIVHRDLKPENILLDSKKNVKLIDFGFCNQFGLGKDHLLTTCCGSPNYAAPEIILGTKYLAPQVDVWSLGVILYVILTSNLPFKGKDLETTYRNVLAGKPKYPSYLSPESVRLLRQMLRVNANQRISLDDVMASPWLQMGYEKSSLMAEEVLSKAVNMETLEKKAFEDLLTFGYNREEALKSLAANETNPIKCTYQLIVERYARRRREKEKVVKTKENFVKLWKLRFWDLFRYR